MVAKNLYCHYLSDKPFKNLDCVPILPLKETESDFRANNLHYIKKKNIALYLLDR